MQQQEVTDGAPVNAPVNGAPVDRGAARPPADAVAGGRGILEGAPLRVVPEGVPAGPLAETVPSDQLWRAAIRAAREAAALAADLRRQLTAGAGSDDGPRAVA
jgi:hypothetical protein